MPAMKRSAVGPYSEGLTRALQIFQYNSLGEDQKLLIDASIAGKDTLGILPTGGGKSACYQIPGVVTGEMTLVISPLIALQEDQVGALRRRGLQAFALHSGLSDQQKSAARYYFKTAPKGKISFLYLSPEYLLTDTFFHQYDGVGFTRAAIDEAHCVSTWGNSFRPDYLRIGLALDLLNVKIRSAFTATVDTKIEKDIRTRLGIKRDCVSVKADPYRENLKISVEYPSATTDKRRDMWTKKRSRLVGLMCSNEYDGPGIVYYSSRDAATTAYLSLRDNGYLSEQNITPHLFHAGLPHEDKEKALAGFLGDTKPWVLATTAFGMGIDRPDVRQVIHYNLPMTLIDYAQGIGRAGRDGKDSLCTTLRIHGEVIGNEGRISFNTPSIQTVDLVYSKLVSILSKLEPAKAKQYNVSRFRNYLRYLIEKSTRIANKRAYERRATAALSLLERAGVIMENTDGLTVHPFIPNTPLYSKLLQMTQMQEKMFVREEERIRQYYGADEQTQELLWSLLSSN